MDPVEESGRAPDDAAAPAPGDAPAPDAVVPSPAASPEGAGSVAGSLVMATLGMLLASLLGAIPVAIVTAVSARGLSRDAMRAARLALFARPEMGALAFVSTLLGSLFVCVLFAAGSPGGVRRRLGWLRPDLTASQFGLAVLATYGLAAFELGALSILFGLHLLPVPARGWLHAVENGMLDAPLWAGVTLAILGGLCPGIAEETMFRGFVQRGLARHWRPWIAIAVSAVAFGLWHMQAARAPGAMLFGLLAGWLAWRTGSTLPAIALHFLNNTTLFLISLGARQQTDTPGAVTAKDWWIAGTLLVTGAAVLLAALRPLRASFAAREGERAAAAGAPGSASDPFSPA